MDLDGGSDCFLPGLLDFDPYDVSYDVDTHVSVCQTVGEDLVCAYMRMLSHDPAEARSTSKKVYTVPPSWTPTSTTPLLPPNESIDPRIVDYQADELYRAYVQPNEEMTYPPTPDSVRTDGSDDEQRVPATETTTTTQLASTRRRKSLSPKAARGRTTPAPARRVAGARTVRRADPQRGVTPPPEQYPEASAEEIEDIIQRVSHAIAAAIVRDEPNGEDFDTLYSRFYRLQKEYVYEATDTLRQVGHSTSTFSREKKF